jgi:GH15 family glucan-1,4-alpha-glucosidase
MTQTPIGDYALLADRHSAALVSRDGSVDWLCMPRFDSPSLFGALLDDAAGSWSVRPAVDYPAVRRYADRSLVLRTEYRTSRGHMVVTDALDLGGQTDPHRLGEDAPHLLVRSVTCTEGEVPVEVSFCPRPEYGLVTPILMGSGDAVTVRGGGDLMMLSTPIPLSVGDGAAQATTTVAAGQTLPFALHWSALGTAEPRVWRPKEIAAAIERTERAWQAWSGEHQHYSGPWAELVHLSGRVLFALSYQPTGAIIAAPTTSLPERPGGPRNWDYRCAWVRDVSLTLDALWIAACPDEADFYFSFLATAAATVNASHDLQIVYGVGGEHDLAERELPHLTGWRNSRPVRVGNGAWAQTQLDSYGQLLAAAHRLSDYLKFDEPRLRRFLIGLADTVVHRWREPDHGIWEIRDDKRHYLHSKLMCWVALDRALALADRLEAADRRQPWSAARDEIRAAIVEQGWSDRARAYTQAFGSDQIDASALTLPIVGFIAGDDPRMLATIDAIERRLTDRRGLVYRHEQDAGGPDLGGEGTFLLCTFWLAQAYALAGRVDAARDTVERAIAHRNDLGLLAEEVEPDGDELLGNFPQAFSHIGLVNAAWAIAERAAT